MGVDQVFDLISLQTEEQSNSETDESPQRKSAGESDCEESPAKSEAGESGSAKLDSLMNDATNDDRLNDFSKLGAANFEQEEPGRLGKIQVVFDRIEIISSKTMGFPTST